MVNLLITLLIGASGGLLAHKLRVPSGALLGSMAAVGIYNCLGFEAFMPVQARVGAQIVVGCILGLRLNRSAFLSLKTVIKPVLIVVPSMLGISLFTGFILFRFCDLDFYTAFLSSTTGGLAELSLLAVALGGDGPKVAILQTIRMITVVSTMPFIIKIMEKLLLKKTGESES